MLHIKKEKKEEDKKSDKGDKAEDAKPKSEDKKTSEPKEFDGLVNDHEWKCSQCGNLNDVGSAKCKCGHSRGKHTMSAQDLIFASRKKAAARSSDDNKEKDAQKKPERKPDDKSAIEAKIRAEEEAKIKAEMEAKEGEIVDVEMPGYFKASVAVENGKKIFSIVPDGHMKQLVKSDIDLD